MYFKGALNMNNKRRQSIRNVIQHLHGKTIDWEWVEDELQDLLDEETDSMENTPENLMDTERYEIMEESCGYLEDAISTIDADDEECAENIVEILEQIDGI